MILSKSNLKSTSNWYKDREKTDQSFKDTYFFKDETWKLADHLIYRNPGIIKNIGL